MTIKAVEPNAQVVIDLEFIRPFKAQNVTTITLVPNGDRTDVTWTLTGPMTIMSRFVGIFFPMDKMVGGDFEKGLAQLKQVAEG